MASLMCLTRLAMTRFFGVRSSVEVGLQRSRVLLHLLHFLHHFFERIRIWFSGGEERGRHRDGTDRRGDAFPCRHGPPNVPPPDENFSGILRRHPGVIYDEEEWVG